MISLHQMKVFVAVAEAGSTSAAAQKLHLSQPSVSLTIRNFEAELGADLFIRNPPKGLSITPFGRQKLEQARLILNEAELFADTQSTHNNMRGTVTIGFFATLGPIYVPSIISHLKSVLPRVEVKLQEGSDLRAMGRMVDTGQVELALTYDLDIGKRPKVEVIKESEFYAVLPAQHPLAKKAKVSLQELAQENFIQIDLPSSAEFLMSPFWHYGLSPEVTYKTSSLEMVRGLVANGLGVSLLVTQPASNIAYDGQEVVCRPILEALPKQQLVLAQSYKLATTPLVSRVAEEIMQLLAEHKSD